MKTLIVSGGDMPSTILLKRYVDWSDYIICADRGYEALEPLSIVPDLLIGDMDSISKKNKQKLSQLPIEIQLLNPIKDETDTEMAVEYAIRKHTSELRLLGGIGTRLDHTLGNIFLLEKYLKNFSRFEIINEHNWIYLLSRGKHKIINRGYKYVSFLAITDEVLITINNMAYEVDHLCLKRSSPRGISNELIEQEAEITIHNGLALCIYSRD